MPARFLALVNQEEHSACQPDGHQLGQSASPSLSSPTSSALNHAQVWFGTSQCGSAPCIVLLHYDTHARLLLYDISAMVLGLPKLSCEVDHDLGSHA